MYTNDVVKVTLQIGEPEAMQLKMDVAITFADALGIVGEKDTIVTRNPLLWPVVTKR